MNHLQALEILSIVSSDSKVYSKVPQWFHLDLLLFILFNNGLPSIFETPINVLLFAGDDKIFSVINSQRDV